MKTVKTYLKLMKTVKTHEEMSQVYGSLLRRRWVDSFFIFSSENLIKSG